MGLTEVFNEAAEKVKECQGLSDDDLLFLYGHFKQSNVGDCDTGKPNWLFDMKGAKKWDAWNACKGMSKEDAMKAYIEKVDALAGTSLMSKI
mmetsp:Transcript_8534/g.15450  ORF Transcript_8534/g.15450 Transcript_8534/m.15450 type:complete len:92 (-) Transcript_8534:1925-2200(-)